MLLGGLKRSIVEKMACESLRPSKGRRWMLWASMYRKSSCIMELTRWRIYSGEAASTSETLLRHNRFDGINKVKSPWFPTNWTFNCLSNFAASSSV